MDKIPAMTWTTGGNVQTEENIKTKDKEATQGQSHVKGTLSHQH